MVDQTNASNAPTTPQKSTTQQSGRSYCRWEVGTASQMSTQGLSVLFRHYLATGEKQCFLVFYAITQLLCSNKDQELSIHIFTSKIDAEYALNSLKLGTIWRPAAA